MKKYFFALMCIGLILASCKPDTQEEKGIEELNPSDWADAIRMPIKDDGTVDSSKMAIIQWENQKFDFGTVAEGKIVEHKFEFTNIGGAPLLISNAQATCGCTVPERPKEPIQPGKTGEIKVKFNSDGWAGKPYKEIKVIANTFPNINKISLTGTVTPKKKN